MAISTHQNVQLPQQNAQRPQQLAGLGGEVMAIAYSPDGSNIVCSTSQLLVQKWQPEFKQWSSFQYEPNGLSSSVPIFAFLHFSRDGKSLYSTQVPSLPFSAKTMIFINNLQRWNVKTQQREQVFEGVPDGGFDISPDEHWAASATDALEIWDLTRVVESPNLFPSANLVRFQRHSQTKVTNRTIIALAFTPSGKMLAAWSGTSEVVLCDVATGKAEKTLTIPNIYVNPNTPIYTPGALVWSPDGQWLAACNGTRLQLWKADGSQNHNAKLPAPTAMLGKNGKMPTLAWSHDGTQIASGGDSVCLWSAPNLKLQRQFRAQGGVAFSPDGQNLATGGFEGTHEVLLWPLKIWPF